MAAKRAGPPLNLMQPRRADQRNPLFILRRMTAAFIDYLPFALPLALAPYNPDPGRVLVGVAVFFAAPVYEVLCLRSRQRATFGKRLLRLVVVPKTADTELRTWSYAKRVLVKLGAAFIIAAVVGGAATLAGAALLPYLSAAVVEWLVIAALVGAMAMYLWAGSVHDTLAGTQVVAKSEEVEVVAANANEGKEGKEGRKGTEAPKSEAGKAPAGRPVVRPKRMKEVEWKLRVRATLLDARRIGIPLVGGFALVGVVGAVLLEGEAAAVAGVLYDALLTMLPLMWLAGLAAYEVVSLGGSQHATSGKRRLGMVVLAADGRGLSYGQAAKRVFFKYVLILVHLLLVYAAWGVVGPEDGGAGPAIVIGAGLASILLWMRPARRGAHHDRAAKTVVVQRPAK